MLRLRSYLLAGSLTSLLAACDPCAGIIGCTAGRYLAASGQIVDVNTGAGLDGVRIDVVRTGGIAVATDSVSATTSGGGFWRVELTPEAAGTLIADVMVSPPGLPAYRLHGVQLVTRKTAGDSNLNERWVPFLYFDYVGEFFLNGTTDTRPKGLPVEFRRTSGISLKGPGQVDGIYRAPTNIAGRIHLFPTTGDYAVFATEDGALTGTLIVHVTARDSTVISGVVLSPSNSYRERRDFPPVIRIPVGP